MIKQTFLLISFFLFSTLFAQVKKTENQDNEINIQEFDTIKMDTILLNDVSFSKVKMNPE